MPRPAVALTRRTLATAAAALLGATVAGCSGNDSAEPPGGSPDGKPSGTPSDGSPTGPGPSGGSPSSGSPSVQPTGTPSSSPSDTAPADPGSVEVVSLRITGGYAGVDRRISVRADGSYTAVRRDPGSREGRLPSARLDRLRRLLTDARLGSRSPRAIDPSLRDSFHYRVAYGDHVVLTDLSGPENASGKALTEAVRLLEREIAKRGSA